MAELRLVFVVGAARSGTTLLSRLIHANVPSRLLSELNAFWRECTPTVSHDAIATNEVTESLATTTRRRFIDLISPLTNDLIIEKTAANCLRIPLLIRAFPEAQIIHIIRDGRDVAMSARRKARGDTRAVTKTAPDAQRATLRTRLAHLVQLAKNHARYTRRPHRMLRALPHYASTAAAVLGLRSSRSWGPRVAGNAVFARQLSSIGYHSLQWRTCVESVLNLAGHLGPEHYFELRYEALLARPEETLGAVLRFLGATVATPGHDIVPGEELWRTEASPAEIREMSEQSEWLLTTLGYPPSPRT